MELAGLITLLDVRRHMQVNVSIGQNHHFALREALLIYRSTEHQNGSFGNTFITHHE